MSLRIMADKHHQSLTKSLVILLEKRLKHELYFPFGRKWFNQGYWKIAKPYNDHPSTIYQYLVAPNDDRSISFDEFIKGDFDVVIASYIEHVRAYYKLIKRHNLKAKLVVQIGNEWEVDWNIVDNLMASTSKFDVPSGKNVVFYHQEFDTNTFRFEPYFNENTPYIRSFVHCMIGHDMHKQDWEDFQSLEKQMPEFKFESYGIDCRSDAVRSETDIADKMRKSKFAIHFKEGGDGYGHVFHNWFAVGRPVIFKGSQYKGKLAGKLLIDGKTGFDYEKGNVVSKIKKQTAKQYVEMCINVHNTFVKEVSFEQEANDIRKFLEKLI